jgi:hypothetical protein
VSYTTGVLFFQLISTKPTLVPYRDFGLTVNDIMGASIDGSCEVSARSLSIGLDRHRAQSEDL